MKQHLSTLFALIAFAVGSAGLAAAEKPETPARISFGQEIKLEDYLVPGKTTVFDFTSKYCPPCEAISPYLDKLHAAREDVVIIKVDINRPDVTRIDWKSPVAAQYQLRSIPHFKIYGADGKLQSEGQEASDKVISWIEAM